MSLVACGNGDAARREPQRPQNAAPEIAADIVESPSMQFLPRQQEAHGWRLQQDPLVYPTSQLLPYLDRDAPYFMSYDCLDMTVGQYQLLGSGGVATVEIFRFPDFVKAFGAYSARRKAVTAFLPLGNEAFVGPHSIHIWSGPFYVRMIGGGAPQMLEAMKQLAVSVAERMPRAPAKPAIYSFFPETFRLANSEVFASDPGFGQRSLSHSFQAQFNVDGELIEGLIFPAASRQNAAKTVDDFRSFFIANGKLLDPIANLGEDNFTGEDRYFGRVICFRIDRFVIAFRGFKERRKLVDLASATNQRILGTIKRQLVTADKKAGSAAEEPGNGGPDWSNRGE